MAITPDQLAREQWLVNYQKWYYQMQDLQRNLDQANQLQRQTNAGGGFGQYGQTDLQKQLSALQGTQPMQYTPTQADISSITPPVQQQQAANAAKSQQMGLAQSVAAGKAGGVQNAGLIKQAAAQAPAFTVGSSGLYGLPALTKRAQTLSGQQRPGFAGQSNKLVAF